MCIVVIRQIEVDFATSLLEYLIDVGRAVIGVCREGLEVVVAILDPQEVPDISATLRIRTVICVICISTSSKN